MINSGGCHYDFMLDPLCSSLASNGCSCIGSKSQSHRQHLVRHDVCSSSSLPFCIKISPLSSNVWGFLPCRVFTITITQPFFAQKFIIKTSNFSFRNLSFFPIRAPLPFSYISDETDEQMAAPVFWLSHSLCP